MPGLFWEHDVKALMAAAKRRREREERKRREAWERMKRAFAKARSAA